MNDYKVASWAVEEPRVESGAQGGEKETGTLDAKGQRSGCEVRSQQEEVEKEKEVTLDVTLRIPGRRFWFLRRRLLDLG